MCLLLVIFLKPNQKYEPLNVANFCPCGISFDELPEFKSDVMHIGLFITRKQKCKNWNVIHRTFPFLQKQLQLEQSIGMYILRLNIDGQLEQKVRHLAQLFIQKSYILPFQSDKSDSCVDPLDYLLLPMPPLVDEEGIWRLKREDSRGRGRGSHKASMTWKVRTRPFLGAYTVSMDNCIQ